VGCGRQDDVVRLDAGEFLEHAASELLNRPRFAGGCLV
jgi:hypothetical protein